MKTPLAYFRGFQLASGADLKAPSLQQRVMENYFFKERLVRIHETKVLVAAMAGGKDIGPYYQTLMNHLFPEQGKPKEDFRLGAQRQMDMIRSKVFEISMKDGIRSVTMRDIRDKDVAQEVQNLFIRNKERGRRRPLPKLRKGKKW